jgi:hypothetical protein
MYNLIMNFYRLRFVNTIMIFVIGIMIGVYISNKKGFIKNIFSFSSNYVPVYYNKKNITDEYVPKYYRVENKENIQTNYIPKIKNENLVEKVKNQNPISDDDESFILVDTNSKREEKSIQTYEVDDFVKNPSYYKNSTISGKLVLLKGEINRYPILYFLYSSNYYITVRDEKNIIKKTDEYKIGYIYDVTFITDGALNSNILVSISPTDEKTNWSMGVNAF